MDILSFDDVSLHVQVDGPENGPAVVFGNSLGTDLRLWDAVVPLLPEGLRLIRFDLRGHGLSSCPPAPYGMGTLVRDAERVMEALDARDAVFVGLSIGGLIAQGLAAKRLDLVRAVVLSNTAAKIGTRAMWEDRIEALRRDGLASMADTIMARWFSRAFRESPAVSPWRRMVETCPEEGYAGCCAAIAGSDFYTTTASLRLPALVIAGDQDGATPPDLVRELAELIPGSKFELMRGAGHLPCVEDPTTYAAHLTTFLSDIGHLP
ncbi:3-oxoadipate enol-lactonase [Gymnodinialimonas ceratoperidinii]|uniref:3-oxoadipate enol-lactonase n=1 Tax=Gymnodinialimonas ceratoperidinii TaxID=2856823 RepID=A0A8F6TW95_9RHOB|nr:3-oxoadipate enol-lactonase [Gymnodinialimonas ceratoperidinii]QXT38866.1 3-oxoadipate enol-lactonase [Gymnodinialimonas ceratoperidinii]